MDELHEAIKRPLQILGLRHCGMSSDAKNFIDDFRVETKFLAKCSSKIGIVFWDDSCLDDKARVDVLSETAIRFQECFEQLRGILIAVQVDCPQPKHEVLELLFATNPEMNIRDFQV